MDAAFTCDALVAHDNYIHRRANEIVADETSSSFQCATNNKVYLFRRMHLDSQVATLVQKHDVSRGDKTNIEPLGEESGFNIKFRNVYEQSISRSGTQTRRNHRIGDDLRNFVYDSVWSGTYAKEVAIEKAADKILITDLNGNRRSYFDKLRRLRRIKVENFHDGSSLFERLHQYIVREHKNNIRARLASSLDATYQQHKRTLVAIAENMENYHLVDDEYVLLLPSTSCVYISLYRYLNRLMDRDLVGDEERMADLTELGWSFDDGMRTKAMITNLSCDTNNNDKSKGREEQQKENERTNTIEDAMEQMKQRNEGFDFDALL